MPEIMREYGVPTDHSAEVKIKARRREGVAFELVEEALEEKHRHDEQLETQASVDGAERTQRSEDLCVGVDAGHAWMVAVRRPNLALDATCEVGEVGRLSL